MLKFLVILQGGSNSRFKWIESPNYEKLTERNQIKIEKSKFEKLHLEHDVIHDANEAILYKNLKKTAIWAHSAILPIKVF